MKFLKQGLLDVAAVVFFAILAFAYFYPADVENRVLNQGDISAGIGAGEDTYQIAPSYHSTDTVSFIEKAYHLWLPDNVWYLFVYLLGFYILLRAFDFRQHRAQPRAGCRPCCHAQSGAPYGHLVPQQRGQG